LSFKGLWYLLSISDVQTSTVSTSVLPEEDVTPTSTETEEPSDNELPFGLFNRLFRTLFRISLHDLAEIQRYLHRNISGFTTEACEGKEKLGHCAYIYVSDSFVNGNETCSVYTMGNCTDESRR
jgi:hypothetical protein